MNRRDKALDTSVAIVIVVLMAGSIAVFLIWLKEIAWDFIKGRKTGTVRPATLKDILLIVLMFPVYLTGIVGAVWLFYQGWEGFERTVLLCAEASFGFGFFLALVYYIANVAGRRIAKNRVQNLKNNLADGIA
ncbi:MAG: hypothetical protein ACUVT5_06520 [Candidatus Bathyarchaeales archaeon]